jgi:phage terminase small subunit
MSILKNNRHEIFAQGLAIGMTAHAAYVAAGYKKNRGNAATTKANQSVSDRVREIKQAAAQRAAGTLDDIIAKLEYITLGGMSKFVRIGDSGQPKIDLSDC